MNDDYTYVATDKGLGKFSFLAGVAAKGIHDDVNSFKTWPLRSRAMVDIATMTG